MCGPEDQLRKLGSCGRAVLDVERRWSTSAARRGAGPGRRVRGRFAGPDARVFHDDGEQGRVRGGRFHSGDLATVDAAPTSLSSPQEGHDQDRRRECREPRGRGNDLQAAAGLRGGGGRRAASALGRGGGRGDRGQVRAVAVEGRGARPLRRAPGAFQGAEDIVFADSSS